MREQKEKEDLHRQLAYLQHDRATINEMKHQEKLKQELKMMHKLGNKDKAEKIKARLLPDEK
jgi:hypothetical protein